MKKYVFVLLVFGFFAAFFFSSYKEDTNPLPINEISEISTGIDSAESSLISNPSLSNNSSVSSIVLTSSSYATSSSPFISDTNTPWAPVSPSQEVQKKVDTIIGEFPTPVTRAFVKIDPVFLERIEVGGIYEIPVPDAVDADMHVINIEKKDGLTNVVGHLSGYPESYYIGFSYDTEGHIYGEITTEKSNYSIKTYYEQPVIIKVLPEMEKTQRNDF